MKWSRAADKDSHQRDRRRRPRPLRGPGVQPEDHPAGRSPQGPDRGPDALRLHHALGRRPPPAADPHHARCKNVDEGPKEGSSWSASSRPISEGRDPGTPNCFLFPLPNGAWRVYRFSPGINEADTWTQDGQGWTTCYFNRYPDLSDRLHALRRRGARRRRLRLLLGRGGHSRPPRALGEELELPRHRRSQGDAQGPQRRPAGRRDRTKEGRQEPWKAGTTRRASTSRFSRSRRTPRRTTNSTSTNLTTSSAPWRRPPSSTPAG